MACCGVYVKMMTCSRSGRDVAGGRTCGACRGTERLNGARPWLAGCYAWLTRQPSVSTLLVLVCQGMDFRRLLQVAL